MIVMQVHKGTKPFKCDTCDAGFTSKQGLKGHIASIHGGTKSFKCTACDASFAQKIQMQQHTKFLGLGFFPLNFQYLFSSF